MKMKMINDCENCELQKNRILVSFMLLLWIKVLNQYFIFIFNTIDIYNISNDNYV